jgi:hypothetical protein
MAGLMIVGLIPKTEPMQICGSLIQHLFVGAFFTAGVLLVLASRRHFARRLEDVLSKDPREPVLFPRQFGDDDVRHEDPTLPLSFARTFEERMVRALGAIGSVVAIGRPGDHLPPPGAARIYLSNEAWQAEVSACSRDRCPAIHRVEPASSVSTTTGHHNPSSLRKRASKLLWPERSGQRWISVSAALRRLR